MMERMQGIEKKEARSSSDVQLKRLELAANGIATGTPWCSSASMFADENIHTLLTEAADAF
jgi:hypothetical protein